MKENWVRIYRSTDLMKVKIAEGVLKQNGIESHIVNKPDSMLPMLGEAELFTPPEKSDAALKALEDNKIE
ncbi:MAG: putative signal transducing protein [Saprospiraceae bacterium]